jgi:hypothetical protein
MNGVDDYLKGRRDERNGALDLGGGSNFYRQGREEAKPQYLLPEPITPLGPKREIGFEQGLQERFDGAPVMMTDAERIAFQGGSFAGAQKRRDIEASERFDALDKFKQMRLP